MVLIDMAVTAFANAMRIQSMVGNTALIIEGEMFGQPTLRAKCRSTGTGYVTLKKAPMSAKPIVLSSAMM
jgi:hypothetical protein